MASSYLILEPTTTNRKNNSPASKAFLARAGGVTYHLQNVALMLWYTGRDASLGSTFSFPNPKAAKLHGTWTACRRCWSDRTGEANRIRRPAQQGTERTSAHRLVVRLWRCRLHLLASRGVATVGRHHRCLRYAGQNCAGRDDAVPYAGRAGNCRVQGRYRVSEDPGKEGTHLARRRRPALHSCRSNASFELCLVGRAHLV